MKRLDVRHLAAAGLLAMLAACAPKVHPVDIYVNPTSQEKTCVQPYGNRDIGRYSVILSNDVGNYQLVMTRNYYQANRNKLNAFSGELNVPVTITFPDGAVHEYSAWGNGNNQSTSVSHDVVIIRDIEEAVVRKLLVTTGDIRVAYSGQHGSEEFTVAPATWVALNAGFGQSCMH